MSTRILKFISNHSLFSRNQFGFQKNKSTTDAILNLIDKIYNALNKKDHTLSLFVDFRKAFDTVNNKILLNKLFCYGIRGLPLSWFESYLSAREQCVRIGNSNSSSKFLNIGVPQGSILGPILFLLYVNDLPYVSSVFHAVLYADDTTLSVSGDSYDELSNVCNVELEKINEWMISNRLSLNVEKTYSMLFSNRLQNLNNNPIIFNGKEVAFCSDYKFLGIQIDNSLKFNLHIQYICNKLSKSVGILYKLKPDVPNQLLLNLYYNFVYPYLIYGNLIWGGTYHTHLEPLILIQKKIIRILNNESYLAHTTPLFYQSSILKVKCIHTYVLAQYMFKCVSDGNAVTVDHEHNTRGRDNLVPPFHRLGSTQRSPSFAAVHVWNNLPSSIRDCNSLPTFKHAMKNHLISQYNV
jgi:hypothetical protein